MILCILMLIPEYMDVVLRSKMVVLRA